MPATTLSKLTEHVYWMSPGPPDRPSLCAIVGADRTLLLDAGASAEHARLFIAALQTENVTPHLVALTHWHWDHVFGAAELGLPLIAHRETTAQLATLAAYDWSDEALDARVANGEEIPMCAGDIKLELPAPRSVEIALPQIVFDSQLEIHLGGVTCRIQHVGGDHAADSCVMFVEPDRVLFLGDCLYDAIYTPHRHYTKEKLFPVLDAVLSFDADHYIQGHADEIMTRAQTEALAGQMRFAGNLVTAQRPVRQAVFKAARAQLGPDLDEDTQYFLDAFIAGLNLSTP